MSTSKTRTMDSCSLDISILYDNRKCDKQNEIKEKLAQIFLKSKLQTSILLEDDKPKVYDLIKTDKPISNSMFPTITKIIKTGSRAEQVYLEESDGDVKSSDVDYIYEVGPAVVTESDEETFVNFKCYKWKATNNVGFYNIQDKNGAFVNPVVMQTKVAPMIERAKIMAELPKPGPSLPKTRLTNISPEDEDEVISLKCFKWPTNVWEKFESRDPMLHSKKEHKERIMKELKESNIYFVPKSHPESEDPWIEWRLSFSMIEIKIMENLPYIFRKVLLLCKSLSKKIVIDEHNKITSYILKTVFLWKCEEWNVKGDIYTEDNLFNMVQEVFADIKKRCFDKRVPQYFLPTMNLMDFFEEDEVERVTSSTYLDRLTQNESLIDIIIGKGINHLYPLIRILPSSQKGGIGNMQYYTTPGISISELPKSEKFAYVLTSFNNFKSNEHIILKKIQCRTSEENQKRISEGKLELHSEEKQRITSYAPGFTRVTSDKIDVVVEIYSMFLFILKEAPSEVLIKYERFALYALETFSGSLELKFKFFTDDQCEDKFFWKEGIDFEVITSKINCHLDENKDAYIKKEGDVSFFNNLVPSVSKMLKLDGLKDAKFCLPTPGVFLEKLNETTLL